jgi:hypothetical protein
MKKIILILISISLIISCNEEVKPGHIRPAYMNTNESDAIRYFKDYETNKCFAERGRQNEYTFTCVPCDSLVMEKIKRQEYANKNN